MADGLPEALDGGERHEVLCFGIERLLADCIGAFHGIEVLDGLLNTFGEAYGNGGPAAAGVGNHSVFPNERGIFSASFWQLGGGDLEAVRLAL